MALTECPGRYNGETELQFRFLAPKFGFSFKKKHSSLQPVKNVQVVPLNIFYLQNFTGRSTGTRGRSPACPWLACHGRVQVRTVNPVYR
jgi:hypothetical protein